MIRCLTLLAILAVTVGCQSNESAFDPYPETWDPAPMSATGDCTDLAGTYTNAGEASRSFESLGRVTLSGSVFHRPMGTAGLPETVRLSIDPDGSLRTRYDGPGADSATEWWREFSNAATCENGWLIVDGSTKGYSEGTWTSRESQSKMRLIQGSLVVRYAYDEGFSYFGFDNHRESGLLWLRFPRVE